MWESQNKCSNTLLGSLESLSCAGGAFPTLVWQAGPCSLDFIRTDEAPDSPFFPVSHTQTPFILSFPGGGCAGCGGAMCYKWPQPSSTLLPGEMRKECTQLLPALAALQSSLPSANFTGALKGRGKAGGVTTLFTTQLSCNGGQEWNFIALKMPIPLALGYLGVQSDKPKS